MSRIESGGRAGRGTRVPRWLLALPVLVTAAIAAAGLVVGPAEPSSTPAREVRLDRGSYACPGGLSTTAGQLSPGDEATARSLPLVTSDSVDAPDARSVDALADPRTWRSATTPEGSTVVSQSGRGTGAVGFVSGRLAKDDGGGLVVAGCPSVADDAWFTGLGSGSKHQSTLLLTNTADTPAAVDVELWNTQGVVDAIDNDGIVVPAGASRRVRLADLAAGERQLAVHVVRLRGALTVSALDTSTAVFQGSEISTGSVDPARTQWVPGVVAGEKGRTLVLVNPGDTTARVSVTAFGAKGRFVPEGLSDLKVRAGRLRQVVLPRTVGSGAVALRLTSDEPVAASVRLEPDTDDFARAESAPVLDGTAAVPLGLDETKGVPDLILSGVGRRSATVRLVSYDAAMKKVDEATVTVEAGRTDVLDLADELTTKGAAVVLVRGAGDVVGAATYASGSRIASVPLVATPVTALGPRVRVVGP
ncbi:hypothetical protein ASD11_02450 [Aeromicrobium sp. Root495]|uniref:DUF5719 family protein n=1 Tax=Aeromicrobium sp. Root495 TaxID=1736550 RepID=UPI0006F7146A|nr:DUF5719 family protein [Aeromicrobium sp. Root495]KQY58540.1 hypothetical protein ASD11_02450 [Aeromicrobium sp. Root495]